MGVNFNQNYPTQTTNVDFERREIDLESIEVYTTEKEEHNRTNFNDTFETVNQKDDPEAEKFVEGLVKYKPVICETLGIEEAEYDALSCIALGLASQETGMGKEKEYIEENTNWFQAALRSYAKAFDVWFRGGGSGSCGPTQIKIYDFLNPSKGKLTNEEIGLLKSLGVKASAYTESNLYSRPDLSAATTIVILSNLNNHYDIYSEKFDQEHQALTEKLCAETGLDEEECLRIGQEKIDGLVTIYDSLESNDEKEEFRNLIKNWFMSKNGSILNDGTKKEENEEYNLQKLNEFIAKCGGPLIGIQQSDLDFIRYTLTSPENKFTREEAIIYMYNHGTSGSAWQLDRYLTAKFGNYFRNPEIYDYDQYVQNVTSLTSHYAEQLGLDDEYMQQALGGN